MADGYKTDDTSSDGSRIAGVDAMGDGSPCDDVPRSVDERTSTVSKVENTMVKST